MAEKVTLASMDGETLEVDQDIAFKSLLVKGIVEDGGADDEIPLPAVKKVVLDKIIEYCTHINTNPEPVITKPLKSNNLAENIEGGEWFVKYIDLESDMVFEIMLASNFMDVKSLLLLCSAKIATLIKGKSIQETR